MVQAVAGGRSTPPPQPSSPPPQQDYLHHHYYHHDETSSTYTSPYPPYQHHHHRRIVPVQGHTAMEAPGGSCDDKGRIEASVGVGVEGKGKVSGSVPWNHEARGQEGSESEGGQGGGEREVGGEEGSGEGSPVIRLLVLGGHAVGKSAITVRYLTRRFIGEYKSQVDIIYRQAIQMDDFHVDLEIVDISSRPGDNTLPTMEICQCDCYLVVYSVAERHTFLTANQLLHAIFRLRPNCPRPPITLLGNKQDLEHSRQVSAEEGATTSTVFGCDFAEVSVAETSEDIVPVFTSLIRRARAAACLCPLSPASCFTAPPSSLPPICRHVNCQTCRLCFYRGKELRDWGILRSASPCRALGGAESGVGGAARKEDRCRRRNSRNHKQAVRSLSSPLQKTKSFSQDVSDNDASLEPQLGLPISNTPIETEQSTPSFVRQSAPVTGKENVNRNVTGSLGHTSLARSLSSPGGWSEEELSNEEENSQLTDRLIKESTNVFTNLKAQASTLPLLTRGRSFIMDSLKQGKNPECYCGIQGRTRSFKSSGKVEIVTLKRTEIKKNNKDETNRHLPGKGLSAHHDGIPSKAFASKLLKRDTNGSHRDRLEEKQPSTLSLPAASKAPRSPRWLPIDNMDNSLEEGCHSPTSARQRKFSVFGVGRALGNFLSKGSLPDLPRATANICDKFGSLKRTIKKRSV